MRDFTPERKVYEWERGWETLADDSPAGTRFMAGIRDLHLYEIVDPSSLAPGPTGYPSGLELFLHGPAKMFNPNWFERIDPDGAIVTAHYKRLQRHEYRFIARKVKP